MEDSGLRRALAILAQPDILSRLRNTPNYPLHTVIQPFGAGIIFLILAHSVYKM